MPNTEIIILDENMDSKRVMVSKSNALVFLDVGVTEDSKDCNDSLDLRPGQALALAIALIEAVNSIKVGKHAEDERALCA